MRHVLRLCRLRRPTPKPGTGSFATVDTELNGSFPGDSILVGLLVYAAHLETVTASWCQSLGGVHDGK